MTHAELVDIAANWVHKKFDVTIKEKSCGIEIPDVVGISLSRSILVECKVSRSDFHADKRKYSRLANNIGFANEKIIVDDRMLGNYRVYCCPKGLLNEDDIPDDWGLLEVFPSGFARLKNKIFYDHGIYWHNLSEHGLRQERHLIFTAFRDRHETHKVLENF